MEGAGRTRGELVMSRVKVGSLVLVLFAATSLAAAPVIKSARTPVLHMSTAKPMGYQLWYQPIRQIQLTYTDTTTLSSAQVKEWIFWQAAAKVGARQDVKYTVTPGGEAGVTQAPDKRPLEFFRKILGQPESPSTCTYKAVYTGWLADLSLRRSE